MEIENASEQVKTWAVNGRFEEITSKFGAKKCDKAENYAKVKLDALADKVKKGVSTESVAYATPFMMFALKHMDKALVEVAKLFDAQHLTAESSQLSASDSRSSELKNTPSQTSSVQDRVQVSEPPSHAVVTPLAKAKGFTAPAASHSRDKKGTQGVTKAVRKKGITKDVTKSGKITKTTKASKAVKDPNAPKKAKSSYMFFAAHARSDILAEDPGKSLMEVAKETGVRWKALTDEEKKPFLQQAAADKERYDSEMKDYRTKYPAAMDVSKGSKGANKKKGKKSTKATPAGDATNSDAGGEEGPVDEGDVRGAIDQEEQEDGGKYDGAQGSGEVDTEPAVDTKRGAKRKAAQLAEQGMGRAARGEDVVNEKDQTTGKGEDKEKQAEKRSRKTRSANRSNAIKTSTAIAHLKQQDLDLDDDLLHTEFNPRQTGPYPPAVEFAKGMEVSLALEPYRTFLSQLPAGAIAATTMQEVQRICAASSPVVHCTVKVVRSVPSQAAAAPSTCEVAPCYTLLTVTVAGREYKVLHADLSSPLLTCDTFLVAKTKFEQSLKAPWVVVNAQVKCLFATEDPDVAEWQEGSIYHIREDILTNPYGAVEVAWLQQERGADQWVYSYTQTDSECSPWDLDISSFVLLQNVRPPSVPRALLVGTLDPALVIEYLKTFDAAGQFMLDMSQCEDGDYCALFPSAEDRWDLPRITRLCRQGRYSGTGSDSTSAELGILALFIDLERMVAQSKAYNDCNAAFLPWRLAHMLQCAVHRLKQTLAEERGLACLQRSLEEEGRELAQRAREMEAEDL